MIQITAERFHSDFMEDYCDGEVFKNHPLFSLEKKALQLLLYYDEVEICNPLGSKRKIHKLGMCAYIRIVTSIPICY